MLLLQSRSFLRTPVRIQRVNTMASPKPYASVSEESSEVQVLDSIEPLVTASSSTPSASSARVMDSIEPLVPTVVISSNLVEPVAGPSGMASGSGGSQPATASSSDEEDEFAATQVPRPTGSSGRRLNPYSDELRSMWNWRKIFLELGTHDQCVQFAEERNLILTEKLCSYHRKPMTLTKESGQLGKFRCRKSNCRTKTVSRASGTWFEDARLPLTFIFQIMYAFSEGISYHQTRKQLASQDSPVLSSRTVANWFNYCREVIAVHELQNQRVQGKIGGPNKVVQIDKSKFGKRKYNRGRQIEGHWVIGMIEDGNDDFRLEVCPDNERSAEILVPLIKKHVAEGSIIHTDYWRAYMSLPDHGYIHNRVNHSDPVNKFVNQWRGLKKHFRQSQNKQDFTLWLSEYSWRRRIYIDHLDPYEELLKAIKFVYDRE
ncbi:uncharacterized protein LOC133525162 [Cydia pomonella]|uniref:uncharacterized protein LOC133525162 n=1 Tax=Cydia pomonella TaxID=82600 RepID=UPI002ADD883C|nr:uncharacterized protein LOC133525162 [Cydia pomonella]